MYSSWKEEVREYVQSAVARQLTEESPQAAQPAWIRTALRPHQLSLLAAARSLEERASIKQISLDEPQLLTRFGVLSDRVGAGKSLVALSLVRDPPVAQAQFLLRESGAARILGLTHMPAVQPFSEEWRGAYTNATLGKHLFPTAGTRFYTQTALIVVPHNVVTQWESYAHEQTDLRVYVARRTKDCDYDREGFLADVFGADAVLVSCTMLRKFIGAVCYHTGAYFQNIVWSRLYIDEADTIHCALRPGDVTARFTWFITGSWMNMLFSGGLYEYSVQNLPEDVRALIGGASVAGVGSTVNVVAHSMGTGRDPRFTALILRNSDEWIHKSVSRPTITHETVMCRTPANVGILRDFISPAALEALHAGDTAGAMSALGIKATSKESLAEKVSANLRAELVQAEKILAFKRDIDYSSAAAKATAVEKAEQRVSRLRDQIAALESRIAGAATELCPICYDTPRTATMTPCCRQIFCLSCLCECISKKPACPLCRGGIENVTQLTVIEESAAAGAGAGADASEEDALPTKGAALLKILAESSEDQRFLVFSAHEASFKGLREMLSARGIRCELLSGSAARLERLRTQFRDGVVRVLCMNARHVGAGINLEAATDVVLYHRMNAELEKQVIGRAVRFERAGELRVVHLVHEQETAANGAHSSDVIIHV
jgi:hypothetical protein